MHNAVVIVLELRGCRRLERLLVEIREFSWKRGEKSGIAEWEKRHGHNFASEKCIGSLWLSWNSWKPRSQEGEEKRKDAINFNFKRNNSLHSTHPFFCNSVLKWAILQLMSEIHAMICRHTQSNHRTVWYSYSRLPIVLLCARTCPAGRLTQSYAWHVA